MKFGGRFFQTKLLSRLSHKVCRPLSSTVRLRKFTFSEFTQQLGRREEEEGKTLVRDKRDRGIACVFCRDLHLTLIFSGLLQKDLCKGKLSLAKSYFKQNYCHTCHTRIAAFFPLPSVV